MDSWIRFCCQTYDYAHTESAIGRIFIDTIVDESISLVASALSLFEEEGKNKTLQPSLTKSNRRK